MRIVGDRRAGTLCFSPADTGFNNTAFIGGGGPVPTKGPAMCVAGCTVFGVAGSVTADATVVYIPVDADGVTELVPNGEFGFGLTAAGGPRFQFLGGGFVLWAFAYLKLGIFGNAGGGNGTLRLFAAPTS